MLTHKQYAVIAPLLPPKRRPPKYSNKQVLDAVLYVMTSGCSWRQLPKKYGHWHTIYTRFKRWSEAGVLDRIFKELQKKKILDLRVVFLDSTIVRAHQAASGAHKKKGLKPLDVPVEDWQRRFTSLLQERIQEWCFPWVQGIVMMRQRGESSSAPWRFDNEHMWQWIKHMEIKKHEQWSADYMPFLWFLPNPTLEDLGNMTRKYTRNGMKSNASFITLKTFDVLLPVMTSLIPPFALSSPLGLPCCRWEIVNST